MIGTIALFRMAKRVPVVQHHFRHPCAPRCDNSRVVALRRLAQPRFASMCFFLLTGACPCHPPASPVAFDFREGRQASARTAFCHKLPRPRGGRSVAQGAQAEGSTGRERALAAKACLPELAAA